MLTKLLCLLTIIARFGGKTYAKTTALAIVSIYGLEMLNSS